MWHWQYMTGWGWLGWIAMLLGMLVFWGGLAALLVALLRPRDRREAGDRTSPDQLLAQRYARGEIDDEEYARRRRVLHDNLIA